MFRYLGEGADIYYKAFPTTWDATSEIGKKRIIKLKETLRKHLPIKEGKALDVGCGTGISTFALEELGFEVIGIDIRKEAIHQAKEIAKERGSKAKFYFMDAKRLEFENESFDLVTLLGSPLPHFSVYDFDEITMEAYRVLKPKGVLVIEYIDTIKGLYSWHRDVFVEGLLISIYKGFNSVEGLEERFFINLNNGTTFSVKFYLWAPWIAEFILRKAGFEVQSHYIREDSFDSGG
ncbi:class I SAM-dependent methyltransferase [Thermococcus thioreducens]|nr:class I SAM-dependent methyltransferase [Thermococcus thioreducens]ASJ12983.1 ubiquinone biosynthesis protein UbiE [Thermococcus thioreducens]KQH81470.1 ubiquinone biosynthesis protein UbiE [Thermococcus thioreducens]